MLNVLFLSPLSKGSGNFSTVCRLREHFEVSGYRCFLRSPDSFTGQTEYTVYIDVHDITMVIGIHAYRAGKFMAESCLPYVLILGGTDLNVYSKDEGKMATMTLAVDRAQHVIAFNDSMRNTFLQLWPDFNQSKLSTVPQAVQVCPSNLDFRAHVKALYPSLDEETKIFLIAGGIRPVKNPLYLVRTFSDWVVEKNMNCVLAILGPEMEPDYFTMFENEIQRCPAVIHVPAMELGETHAAIQQSFVLVNSSESEGMPIAILEAMALGTPVIVRGIHGNRTIVEDGVTGYIYDTVQEFIVKAEDLLKDVNKTKGIIQSASEYVVAHHSLETERNSYLHLVKKIVGAVT